MKFKLLASLFTSTVVIGLGLNLASLQIETEAQAQTSDLSETKFICKPSYDPETQQPVPTTYAWQPHKKIPIVRWTSTLGSKEEWTPQKRCEEVSSRFQEAHDNGSLEYLTHGTINAQAVICTARSLGEDCDTLILTLRSQDNTEETLEQLSNVLLGYVGGPLEQSSDDPVKVHNNRIYIEFDVESFPEQP